ncbi:MAG TPA: ATP-binding protein [Candidatus Paceibacterota bacterium]
MRSPINFHQGATLLRVAKTYRTVLDAFLEKIQNAIDSNATEVRLTLNKKTRNASVRDNGDGATIEDFEKALASVGRSIKSREKMGQFGLGLVAFIGKCERHFFTSTPKNNPQGYTTWEFDSAKIVEQAKVEIPCEPVPQLTYSPIVTNKADNPPWRTEMRIMNYTRDRVLSHVTMDDLENGILDQYSEAMRKHNVVVHIRITDEHNKTEERSIRAVDFAGTKLPEVTIKCNDGGTVQFRMYLARQNRKKGSMGRPRKPRVVVGVSDNDFRFNFEHFAESLTGGYRLPDEVTKVLFSGIFEGEILCDKVILAAKRKAFEPDEALLEFVCAIDDWYREYGSIHFKDITSESKKARYEHLRTVSLLFVESLLNRGPETLRGIVKEFGFGSEGKGHFPNKGKEDAIKGRAVGNDGKRKPSSARDKGSHNTTDNPEGEKKTHSPIVSLGPDGQPRRLVRGKSQGFHLAHEPLPTRDAWTLDMETGTLIINTTHHLWIECENHNDRVIERYQELLIIQALTYLLTPEDWRDPVVTSLGEQNEMFVFWLIQGDSQTKSKHTKPTRAPSKKLELGKVAM